MESGPTEVKTQSEDPEIKVEVSIPESLLPFLMSIDNSPSVAIRKFITVQHDRLIQDLNDKNLDVSSYNRQWTVQVETPADRPDWMEKLFDFDHGITYIANSILGESGTDGWDQDSFDKLILSLMESMETREDIDELFSFLIAYGSEESNKPTAIQLKNRMSKQIAESNPEIWNQHLRKCKARLTITAKNLNLPKPFGKPYGKSPERKHPIEGDFHRLLIPWINGSNERCLISLDGQSHEDSMEILRNFKPPQFVIG